MVICLTQRLTRADQVKTSNIRYHARAKKINKKTKNNGPQIKGGPGEEKERMKKEWVRVTLFCSPSA
jgi:hypothetical protein